MFTLDTALAFQLVTWAGIIAAAWLMFQAYARYDRRARNRRGYSAHSQRFTTLTADEAARRPYVVFDTSHDEVIAAQDLVSADTVRRLRAGLDVHIGQLPPLPSETLDRVRAILRGVPGTAVTLLIDNSGSMRGKAIMMAAAVADLVCAALEDAGASVEVLGYTTVGWRGGAVRARWIDHGEPPFPGRLCAVRHIIYKAADGGEAGRHSFGVMTDETLLNENIDGEALAWAHGRLKVRPEKKRILIVLSDGAPVDDSTLMANDAWFLVRHLQSVIAEVEADATVQLAAVGIGTEFDVSEYYAYSVAAHDVAALPAATFDILMSALERSAATA